jgi:hypothetical protein
LGEVQEQHFNALGQVDKKSLTPIAYKVSVTSPGIGE